MHPTERSPLLEPLDLARLSARQRAGRLSLQSASLAETRPHDAPPTAASVARQAEGLRQQRNYAVREVLAWHGASAVGQVFTSASRKGDNPHLLQVEVYVPAARRRQGLGRALLRVAVEQALAERRSLLIGTSVDRVAAGAAFARGVGARPGLVSKVFELPLAELDDALIEAWSRAGPERAPNEALVWIGCPYPEAELERLARLMMAMNDIPLGDLQIGDRLVTPATLRDGDAFARARGDERWTLAARRRADGALVGLTEVLWNASNPGVLVQLATVVLREERGRGLGRWLKAAMLARVRRERPQVQRVRTENASMNAPMRAINDALGFRLVLTETVWQVETEVAAAALAR